MAKKITKSTVEAAGPGSRLWDTELKGFGLRVTKAGAKTYVLKYRSGEQQRWYTIGRHGSPWTPASARKEAIQLLARVAKGEDPVGDRMQVREAETVAAFAERYFRDYAPAHKRASSIETDRINLTKHILPAMGRRLMQDIDRRDVNKLMVKMKQQPASANRTRALLSHMCKVAESWGVRPENSNPCRHVKKYPEIPRERFLSDDELKRLGTALNQAERDGENLFAIAAIRLLLLTGARRNEILTLEWSFVDLKNGTCRLPTSKTGSKTLQLPTPAIDLLNALPREVGNPHVICGTVPGGHLINIQKPWARIRKAAGLEDVRLHDLRHTFASVGAANQMGLPMIGALLGHSQAQTTARYAHLAQDPCKIAADTIAGKITAAMQAEPDNVVPLHRYQLHGSSE